MRKYIKEGKEPLPVPDIEQLKAELKRVKYKDRYKSVLKSTVYALIVVAAVSVLIAWKRRDRSRLEQVPLQG